MGFNVNPQKIDSQLFRMELIIHPIVSPFYHIPLFWLVTIHNQLGLRPDGASAFRFKTPTVGSFQVVQFPICWIGGFKAPIHCHYSSRRCQKHVLVGLEHFVVPYIGNFIIPTDELIFFRGVGQPPTSVLENDEVSTVAGNTCGWLVWPWFP